jgi:hypothetical protein
VTAQLPAGLQVSLATPERALVGSMVPIVIRLQNVGETPLELYLRGRTVAYDILIRDAAGRVVWHRLEGEIVPGIIQHKVLDPREVFELSHEWDQRTNSGEAAGPGLYTAEGIVLTDGPQPLAPTPRQLTIVAQ